MKRGTQKVFVLDYDLISPLGIGRSEVFKSLVENKKAAAPVTLFNAENLSINYAAEVKSNFEHVLLNESNEALIHACSCDRKLLLTMAIYNLMEERLHALLSLSKPERTGIIYGMGADVPPLEKMELLCGKEFDASEDSFVQFINKVNGAGGLINTVLNPYDISAIYLAGKLNLGAFQKTILTACTASTQAIAFAGSSIARRETDVMITGGSDSIINLLAYITFNKLGVLSSTLDPAFSCRPFDINRNGTLAGEGSGLCVLAGEDFILKNKLDPLFEVKGLGNTLDAHNITAPDPKATGMTRAFAAALTESGLLPAEIDYINLHGTGTRSNDPAELTAIRNVFGDSAGNIPMSSTKDRHGHAIAAAGILEFGITCLCMENNFVPANLNLHDPIVNNSEVDLVINHNRTKRIKNAITSNFAFGGVNTVLAIQKV